MTSYTLVSLSYALTLSWSLLFHFALSCLRHKSWSLRCFDTELLAECFLQFCWSSSNCEDPPICCGTLVFRDDCFTRNVCISTDVTTHTWYVHTSILRQAVDHVCYDLLCLPRPRRNGRNLLILTAGPDSKGTRPEAARAPARCSKFSSELALLELILP